MDISKNILPEIILVNPEKYEEQTNSIYSISISENSVIIENEAVNSFENDQNIVM